MKAKLKFKGKELIIEDIKKVSGLGKFTGLMFKGKNAQALLFEFPKGKQAIHSFFCEPFLAIWLDEGKIVDYKLIQPNQLSIKPQEDFDKLIEIPFNEKYSQLIGFFLERGKI